ncbi:hypothetical protein TNCV_519631 [Trichonephila clavipes]|nr:hypothetical protein TNCV_519631 [Trichonephila clavipes]
MGKLHEMKKKYLVVVLDAHAEGVDEYGGEDSPLEVSVVGERLDSALLPAPPTAEGRRGSELGLALLRPAFVSSVQTRLGSLGGVEYELGGRKVLLAFTKRKRN